MVIEILIAGKANYCFALFTCRNCHCQFGQVAEIYHNKSLKRYKETVHYRHKESHSYKKKYVSILNLSGSYQVIPVIFFIPVICQSLHIFSLYCSAPAVKLVSVYPVSCLVTAYISLKKEFAQLYTLHYLQSCIHCTKLKSCWENHWIALRTSAPRAICSQGGFCVSSFSKIKGQVMDHIWYILEKVTKRLT